MPTPKPLLAANWKMHPVPPGALEPDSPYRSTDTVDVAVFPTFFDLETCQKAGLVTGAQAGRAEDSGAYTGDVSLAMLQALGCTYVLCGHSERRMHHHETDDDVRAQAHKALELGLQPIICVGETMTDRNNNQAEAVVQKQLDAVLNAKCKMQNAKCPIIIAYEPVWAIGSGRTPNLEEIQTMHAFIRNQLSIINYPLSILYGGSLKPDNAADIFALPDVDGGLIGGASLDAGSFGAIRNGLEMQNAK